MHKIFSQIKLCGFIPKHEIAKFIVLLSPFLAFAVSIFLFNMQFIFYGYDLTFMLIFGFVYFNRYSQILSKKKSQIEDEFVTLFTYFGIYISNGYNVYQSLNNIKCFASEDLRKLLDKLTTEIDNDKSVNPFINFASTFQSVSIKEVLLSIYQMVEEGEGGNYLRQYEELFGKFSEQRHKLSAEKRKNTLNSLTILPLIGSGIIMVILTISLVQIMGSYLSVL